MVVKILSHSKMRNVRENLLEGYHLKRNTVFYGINGSGKSTICSLLADLDPSELQCTKNPDTDLEVFAFTKEWRDSTVGPFLQGELVPGVMTVQMTPNLADIRRNIKKQEEEIEKIAAEIDKQTALQAEAQKRIDSVIDNVSTGERVKISAKCDELGTQKFRRNSIRTLLDKGEGLEILSPSEVEENIALATSTPGPLSPMVKFPEVHDFPDELWEELATPTMLNREKTIEITQWIKDGLEDHEAGDECSFCTGILTEKRVNELKKAVDELESQVSDLCTNALQECENTLSAFQHFFVRLEDLKTTDVQYKEKLEKSRLEMREMVSRILNYYKDVKAILNSRVNDPSWVLDVPKPTLDIDEFQAKSLELARLYEKIANQISQHSMRCEQAILNLKLHCCAIDGADWKAAQEAKRDTDSELENLKQKKIENEKALEEQLDSISATTETAEFIDQNLCVILGDQRLRVKHDPATHGYRIQRMSHKATNLSEGEQKLISLLYFCAQFKEESRSIPINNTIVLFDDLGSELDEARLYAVDRFIIETFQGELNPKAICYFTHSYAHFRILQGRLASKAVTDENITPTAIFYEIYKKFEDTPQAEHTTQVRAWDDAVLRLDSDYTLSFYLLIDAYQKILDDALIPFSVANDCRKVLEVFTEFKEPGGGTFGIRMDRLSAAAGSPVKYARTAALSQLVNFGSHSELGRPSPVWSRGLLERCVVDTMRYMKALDGDHFSKMLKKTHGGDRALQRKIIEDIVKPFDQGEEVTNDPITF